ncbi:uncharacterized protein PgNI_09477 [Pyricularia grisea]|uniref:SNF2 N-terminal domain-containing protein n=1 Tax=Pyricularia grisea TaxID=148305 RepID=A0A6P8ASC4_PYRGI|nr:uncharacterized protein PgNI_09477 [Pyricularia grisea]TLD05026.1 hypothetical protein PgNI_09477 [Pyricularia grisea]
MDNATEYGAEVQRLAGEIDDALDILRIHNPKEDPFELLDYGSDEDTSDEEDDVSDIKDWPEDIVDASGPYDHKLLPEGTVPVIRVDNYFSEKWKAMITSLRSQKPIDQPKFMETKLHDYQRLGVATSFTFAYWHWLIVSVHRKLKWILENGPLDGAILGDMMGLGKKIQAMTACKLLQHHRGCTNLIVTSASSAPKWEAEIMRHLNEVQSKLLYPWQFYDLPSFMQVKSGKWAWVIVTYEQLVQLFKKAKKAEEAATKAIEKGEPAVKEDCSFYSPGWDLANTLIRFLVVD